MSSSANEMTWPSVIAIAQEDDKLKAVQITKQGGSFKVLWAKSSKDSDTDWGLFAGECGLSAGLTKQDKTDRDNTVVVGFSSEGVAFYHINLPAVKKEEATAIVRLQADTLLPLPSEQIEMTWRTRYVQDGKAAITIAAARREYLQQFVENVRSLEPEEILLDCEAIIKVWNGPFYGKEGYHTHKCVVVSLAARSTQVCLAEDGQLSNFVVLDMGMEDFLETANNMPDSADEEHAQQTETTQRFVQDMRRALESFGYAEPKELPIFILSDGGKAIESIVSYLCSADLNAKAALPQLEKIKAQKEFGIEQLYEYRVPMGLALMALEMPVEGLNLFKNLYDPAGMEEKKSALHSLKIAGLIAAIMFVAFLTVSYAVDIVSPNVIQNRLTKADSNTDINLLMQRQKLIKAVALERPNLLELLKLVNEGGDGGVKLDSFHFKKGQPVSVTGEVQNSDRLYEFQETLLKQNGIKDVKIQSTSIDAKSKKLKFTITFHYKNFTQKITRT